MDGEMCWGVSGPPTRREKEMLHVAGDSYSFITHIILYPNIPADARI
jgi:hypothetical protein